MKAMWVVVVISLVGCYTPMPNGANECKSLGFNGVFAEPGVDCALVERKLQYAVDYLAVRGIDAPKNITIYVRNESPLTGLPGCTGCLGFTEPGKFSILSMHMVGAAHELLHQYANDELHTSVDDEVEHTYWPVRKDASGKDWYDISEGYWSDLLQWRAADPSSF